MTRHDELTALGYLFDQAKMTYYRCRSECCDAPVSHKLQAKKPFNQLTIKQQKKANAKFLPTCDTCTKLCKDIWNFIHLRWETQLGKTVELAHG